MTESDRPSLLPLGALKIGKDCFRLVREKFSSGSLTPWGLKTWQGWLLSNSFFSGAPKMAPTLALRTPLSALIWVLCLALLPAAASAQTPSGTDLGADVRAIFAAKCLECHNPDSESSKARREFDGAWDLALVIAAWSDPIAFDLAPLWEVVSEGSMPPEDADVAALTEQETQQLLHWLEFGTPLPADGNRFVDLQMAARLLADALPATSPVEKMTRSLQQRLRIWLGRNHAAITHFPVALLLLAALMRLFHWGRWRERAWRAEGFCLAFGAPFAALAAGLGWLNAANSGAASDLLERHRWVGVGVVVTSMLLLLLRKKYGTQRFYAWLLLGLALAVAIGGHQGGEMVFGESYLDF